MLDEPAGGPHPPPVPAGGTSRRIRALDARNGHLVWQVTLPPDGALSAPTVVDGAVYEGVGQAGVYALSATTGALLWHRRVGPYTRTTPTVDDHAVYMGDDVGTMHAYDRATGKPLWATPLGGRLGINSAVEANGVVYAATESVFALDASTGAKLWSAPTGEVLSDPTVVNGTVYVGGEDGRMQAFRLNGA